MAKTQIEDSLKPFSSASQYNTSTANQELVTGLPLEYTKPKFVTMSFACEQDCTVVINELFTIKVRKDFGLELDERFETIYSFKIIEEGIGFYFLASY